MQKLLNQFSSYFWEEWLRVVGSVVLDRASFFNIENDFVSP